MIYTFLRYSLLSLFKITILFLLGIEKSSIFFFPLVFYYIGCIIKFIIYADFCRAPNIQIKPDSINQADIWPKIIIKITSDPSTKIYIIKTVSTLYIV